MSRDLLSEATRALRENDEASELEVRATRARVMSGLHQTRVRHRTRLAFLLPIAATFLAASAWGAANGKALLVFEGIERLLGASENSHAAVPAHSARSANPPGNSTVTAPAAAPDGVTSEALDRDAEQAPSEPAPASAGRAVPSASSSSSAADDPTLALYRAAHTAHFVAHDPTRALAAWDAYLAAAPNGSFAPEARYNRALSLIRLGRNSEAESALAPFANGSYGAYRQSEARALLEQLARP